MAAVSYLYAAHVLKAVVTTGATDAEDVAKTVARASQFGIHIPDTEEVAGSGNMQEAILTLADFAHRYRSDSSLR